MLNKPKFLSPSINMHGNMVIDLNSMELPFSCIVDGDEAITKWQIIISKLDDNSIVFDSGEQELVTPFYPINNRNQNVVFKVNLKEYFSTASVCYFTADNTYDDKKVYYTYTDGVYSEYTYNSETWNTDYSNLFYMKFVNSGEEYYWNITLKGRTGNTVSSCEEVFYANSLPKTTIYYSYDNNFTDKENNLIGDLILKDDASLSKRKVFFKADYVQDEDIHIKRYGWRLTDTDNNFVIMDTITQNQIYGIDDDISCECNGLVNQTNYLIELYVETQNGYFNILNNVKFKIDYVVKDIDADFGIVALNKTSGIMLNWGNLRTTEGIVEGEDVSYTTNYPIAVAEENAFHSGSVSINIPNDSRVVFSDTSNGKSLEIDEDSYVVLSFQIDKTSDVVILEMSGFDDIFKPISRKLYYDYNENTLNYMVQKGDDVVYNSVNLSNKTGQTCWYVVTLSPMSSDNGIYAPLKVVENTADNALFPEDELYPDDELYPEIGEWYK